jgi:hypothetical protein
MTDYGPLSAFTGDYGGIQSSGLNAIFRPNSAVTPTLLPTPVTSPNILQLSRIRESLRFLNTPGLLGVPVNRGSGNQGDIALVPIFYDQYVEDTAIPDTPANLSIGAAIIHQEVGMWVLQPATDDEAASVVRQGSIAHGASFVAEGTYTTIQGQPTIPAVSMVPFMTDTGQPVSMPSLQAGAQGTARLPQDLTSFIKAGTITQAILDDPNTLLRSVVTPQKIITTTVVAVDTGNGGPSNTRFLKENALCTRMRATFYIETLDLGILGQWPQIQYFQEVFLQFGGITYPHVTVATLTRDPFPTPILI